MTRRSTPRHALLSRPLLAERLPVWCTLSELFLDTQLDEGDHRRIATALAQSTYSAPELDHILRDEVTPAFGWNLGTVAGEWTGWTDDAVQEIMVRHLRKSAFTAWLARLGTRFAWRSVQPDWHSIRALLD